MRFVYISSKAAGLEFFSTQLVHQIIAVDKKSIALSTKEAIREIEFDKSATTIFPASRKKLI